MPPSESAMPSAPSHWTALFPLALAIVDTLIVGRLNAVWPGEPLGFYVLAIAVLFGVSAIAATFRCPTLSHLRIVLLMLSGIAIGDFVDVLVDGILSSADRTLFPIEIAFLWTVSIVPIALGIFLGRTLHARRKRDTHE